MRLYSNSQVSMYESCNRKHLFSYILGLKGDSIAPAPTFGKAWHRAMDVVWNDLCSDGTTNVISNGDPGTLVRRAFDAWQEEWTSEGFPGILDITPDQEEELKARTPFTALGMVEEYIPIRREFLEDIELISVEQPFLVPLSQDEDLWYCGVLDKVIKYKGRVYIVDHKTTSAYKVKGGFKASFTESFSPDTQIDGYAYAGRMLWGDKFKGIFVDGALVHKNVHDKYCLLPIERQTAQIDSWLWETLDKIQRIEKDKKRALASQEEVSEIEYLPAAIKNTSSCWSFNTPCTYTDLCKAWANPILEVREKGIPIGFKIDRSSPFDHIRLEELGVKRGDITEVEI